MKLTELIDYLTQYADRGKGDALVVVANKHWNPMTESEDICSAVFIEANDGKCTIVLQTE